MNKYKDEISEETIDIRTLFKLFLKRKWWFVGALIIVLAAGMFYVLRKPVIYEVNYKFSLQDDYLQDDYLQYSKEQDPYINNQSVFIDAEDVELILKTDFILQSLNNLEEIEDYKTDISTSLININLEKDTSIITLEVKNTDKELAGKIALNLLDSLSKQIEAKDKEVFDNTAGVIIDDKKLLEDDISYFEDRIAELNEQVQDKDNLDVSETGGNISYEILEKNGEILLYKERIIDARYKIYNLDILYEKTLSEKENVGNRIEILTKEPKYSAENNLLINIIMVILLSIMTGIIVVIAVNFVYKLKSYKK